VKTIIVENGPGSPAEVAKAFHETYEALAPEFGYRTREASAKPWAEVPVQNKALMIATVARLMESGVIQAGDAQ
jgi:hypothetical protein